jgi:chemotaxis regulatin CheY-phosphate phosphatase CheZ
LIFDYHDCDGRLDIFERGLQEVYPIAWTQFRPNLDGSLDVMRTQEELVDDALDELRDLQLHLRQNQALVDVQDALQVSENRILGSMAQGFNQMGQIMGRLSDEIGSVEDQLVKNGADMKVSDNSTVRSYPCDFTSNVNRL